MGNISICDHKENLRRFLSMNTKNERDLFLQMPINVTPLKCRRPRNPDNPHLNAAKFSCQVMVCDSKLKVRLKAFLSLHAIGIKRVKIIQKLTMIGKSQTNQRGMHPNPQTLKTEDILRM